jgi:hypothetical protein
MELNYRACRVLTMPELNLDADCWIPTVDVIWDEPDASRHQLLTGPSDVFKVIDEAEVYAVDMAKSWIDVEFEDDLTP